MKMMMMDFQVIKFLDFLSGLAEKVVFNEDEAMFAKLVLLFGCWHTFSGFLIISETRMSDPDK